MDEQRWNENANNINDMNNMDHPGDGNDSTSIYSYSYVKKDEDTRRSYIPEEPGMRPKKHGFGMKIVKGAVIAAVFGLVAGGVFFGTNTALSGLKGTNNQVASTDTSSGVGVSVEGTAVSTATTVTDVSDVVSNVMPAMVAITNMSEVEYRNWFGQIESYDSEGCGSGIIVSEDDEYLYIATNNHVVAGAKTLSVSFVDDQVVSAEIKGTDENTDLAVVSVKKTDIPEETLNAIKIAVLGDSTKLKLGESAIAIGNALGYGQSVTTGVISAIDREVTVTDSTTGNTYTNSLLQTSAAINPGNSGGALLNMNGEVIGINSVKYMDTEVEGMGYAIPTATAQPIIQELITREEVPESESAYLGVAVVDVTAEVSGSYNMPEGLYIAQIVENSAADQAGLMKGDIITSMDGHKLSSNDELQDLMKYYSAGTEVEIVIQRAVNGEYEEMTVPVTLGSKNQ